MMKPQSQILSEFLAASTPTHWMFDEVAEYLFSDKSEEEREELLDELFDRLEDERDVLAVDSFDEFDLVQFTLRVEKAGGRILETSYTTVPSPVLLLEMCLKLCEPGDEVHAMQRYASGDVADFSAPWPFGMEWAVRATTPMGETLAESHELPLEDLPRFPQPSWRIGAAAGALIGTLLGLLIARPRR